MDRNFAFGENWSRFLLSLNDDRIAQARASLQSMLAVETLAKKSFLDIGSGSGLFSLVARQLGAKVRSFDYDPQCVTCTHRLKDLYFPADENWTIEQASVLDSAYLKKLGRFDIVYSWGVLHHTGAMWTALGNVVPLIAPGGKLFIALYNDQGPASRRWLAIKKLYNRTPDLLKPAVLLPCAARLWGPTMLRDLLRLHPFQTWRTYGQQRGMSPWRDVVDWVGGYPFEVAQPAAVIDFYRSFGLELERLHDCGTGRGCNEFLFRDARISSSVNDIPKVPLPPEED
jgi:2-polyprenyl-6-hydroxyphenyl methylase/3-demethylubiquinone-9 3-methyltransferase